MTHKEINDYKNKVVDFILSNPEAYPTLLTEEQLRNITVYYSEGIVEKLKDKAPECAGFSTKLKDEVEYYNQAGILGGGFVKQYDIFLFFKIIENYCNAANEKYGVSFDLDDVIKSILTHELMHSISVGFEENMKDEAHTDYLAKRIFQALYPDKNYFTSYDYPQTDEYKSEMSQITGDSIKKYLIDKES